MVYVMEGLEQAVTNLEKEADELLAGMGKENRKGTYSEASLNRKIRRNEHIKPEIEKVGLPEEVCEYLRLAYLKDLLSVPGLTRIERFVLILRSTGWSMLDAARYIGVTRLRCYRAMESARRKIARHKENPFAGWYEVYLSEVNRYIYRKPTSSLGKVSVEDKD